MCSRGGQENQARVGFGGLNAVPQTCAKSNGTSNFKLCCAKVPSGHAGKRCSLRQGLIELGRARPKVPVPGGHPKQPGVNYPAGKSGPACGRASWSCGACGHKVMTAHAAQATQLPAGEGGHCQCLPGGQAWTSLSRAARFNRQARVRQSCASESLPGSKRAACKAKGGPEPAAGSSQSVPAVLVRKKKKRWVVLKKGGSCNPVLCASELAMRCRASLYWPRVASSRRVMRQSARMRLCDWVQVQCRRFQLNQGKCQRSELAERGARSRAGKLACKM